MTTRADYEKKVAYMKEFTANYWYEKYLKEKEKNNKLRLKIKDYEKQHI